MRIVEAPDGCVEEAERGGIQRAVSDLAKARPEVGEYEVGER